MNMAKLTRRAALLLALSVAGLPTHGGPAAELPTPALEKREAIVLSPAERELVLQEMHAFLQATRDITAALAAGNMETVVEAARRVGAQAQHAVPASLRSKLPPGFKQLGADTHQRFDRMALDAQDLGDEALVLRQLSEALNNCNACHAVYRLEADSGLKPSQP